MIQKFTLVTILFLLFSLANIYSQPVLQPINLPGVGDVRVNKTINDTTMQPGPSGMNQIWNFSTYFVNPTTLSEFYVSPTGTTNDLLFPSANLKVNSYFGGDDYYQRTATDLIYLGSKSSSNEIIISSGNFQKLLTTPFAFGDSIVNQPVTGTGLLGYALSGTISVKADGTGDLTLYTNAYTNTLRVKTDIDLVQGLGTGVDTYIRIQRYTWYTSTFHEPVLQISMLDVNGALGNSHQKYITLRTVTTNIEDFKNNFNDLSIHPNPSAEKTTISLDLNRAAAVDIKLMDVTGRIWKEEKRDLGQGPNQVALDLTIIPKGFYILSAESGDIRHQRRLVIN